MICWVHNNLEYFWTSGITVFRIRSLVKFGSSFRGLGFLCIALQYLSMKDVAFIKLREKKTSAQSDYLFLYCRPFRLST